MHPTLTHTNEGVALAAVDGAGQPHEPAINVTDLAVGAALLTHPVVTGWAVTWHLVGEVVGGKLASGDKVQVAREVVNCCHTWWAH